MSAPICYYLDMSKRAFITGGSSGIGRAIVKSLQASGWEVIAPSHAELDLSDLAVVSAYAAKLGAEDKQYDAFIDVAGIWHNQDKALSGMKLAEFTAEQITTTINVPLTSAMLLISKLLLHMSNATIIGISGTFENGAAGWLPYYVSKRGLEDLLVGLGQDYPELKVYGISPSDTATSAYRRFFPEYISESQPLEEVSKLVEDLLNGNTGFKSGDVIELRQGVRKTGFHV